MDSNQGYRYRQPDGFTRIYSLPGILVEARRIEFFRSNGRLYGSTGSDLLSVDELDEPAQSLVVALFGHPNIRYECLAIAMERRHLIVSTQINSELFWAAVEEHVQNSLKKAIGSAGRFRAPGTRLDPETLARAPLDEIFTKLGLVPMEAIWTTAPRRHPTQRAPRARITR